MFYATPKIKLLCHIFESTVSSGLERKLDQLVLDNMKEVIRVRRANYVLASCALGAVAVAAPVLNIDLSPESWKIRWEACTRLRWYSLYGCALTVTGLVLMYVMVSHLGVNVFLAEIAVVPFVMGVISYLVHRYKTFEDREVCKHSGGRFAVVRLGGMGVSKVSFILLVGIFGVQYLVASVIIIAVLAWPTYRLNRDWAFRPERGHTPDDLRGQLGVIPPIVR